MRLLGKDITPAKVLGAIGEQLRARGLTPPGDDALELDEVESAVEPLTFNLDALSEHADATRALPMETHRDGLAGRAVTLAKRAFRQAGQVFINEALGRQVVFNGHVRDSYAQLSAEVLRLRHELSSLHEQLEALKNAPPPPPVVAKAPSKPQPTVKKPARRKS